jgi:tripartite-type tricarboxylate transporter receptor subunit TctC
VLRYGLVAPAGTPPAVIEKHNKSLNAAIASPDTQKRLANEGADPLPGTPEEYAADIDKEETKWGTLVRRLGLKVE